MVFWRAQSSHMASFWILVVCATLNWLITFPPQELHFNSQSGWLLFHSTNCNNLFSFQMSFWPLSLFFGEENEGSGWFSTSTLIATTLGCVALTIYRWKLRPPIITPPGVSRKRQAVPIEVWFHLNTNHNWIVRANRVHSKAVYSSIPMNTLWTLHSPKSQPSISCFWGVLRWG
jgi:hypothetical protein